MIRLTISEIRKIARANPEDTLDTFYERLCKRQMWKMVDEFAKNPEGFWEQVEKEML